MGRKRSVFGAPWERLREGARCRMVEARRFRFGAVEGEFAGAGNASGEENPNRAAQEERPAVERAQAGTASLPCSGLGKEQGGTRGRS